MSLYEQKWATPLGGETLGSTHDDPVSEALVQPDYIRLRDNVHLEKPHALSRLKRADSSVIRDITCQLGTPQCRSDQRHCVVMFRNVEGREIRVVTEFNAGHGDTHRTDVQRSMVD
ncbi:hypothetical protein UY286_04955 [Paenibacillus polymyxa]|nr:hypothetical protein [Paenibacillus polymyxa]MDY8116786.1 hypothetical protein [Paenibacillus polymyxa]